MSTITPPPIKREKELKYRGKKNIDHKEKLPRGGEVTRIIYIIKISLNKFLREKIKYFKLHDKRRK